MKKKYKFLFISFVFYLIGHLVWSYSIISKDPILMNENIELFLINFPFFVFSILGLIATYRLYKDF